MRILWVGKPPADGQAGDEVFDRKTIAALRARGHAVDLVHPTRAQRSQEIANLLRGVPHYRTRFATAANRRLVEAAWAQHDITVCSWEPLDTLVPHLHAPIILIAHNVTSLALPQLYPGNRLVRLAARRAARWEAGCYTAARLAAIATLSRRDQDHVAALPGAPDVLLTVPGMPPIIPLSASSGVSGEIVLSGTYDWRPKRRDMVRFAEEYVALADRLPVRAGALPPVAAALLRPKPAPDALESAAAIRFGVVTDRFEAGHKLKTLAHIAQNQLVLAFSDAAHDIVDMPDHAFFIRRLHAAADMAGHVAEIMEIATRDPAGLRARFATFQRRCAERFTWGAVADSLAAAAAHATERRQ